MGEQPMACGVWMMARQGCALVVMTSIVCTTWATVQDLSAGAAPPASWRGSGEFEMFTGFGSADAGWVHVEVPLQLKWSSSECFHLRSSPKVDPFFCHDDPAGEAVWVVH